MDVDVNQARDIFECQQCGQCCKGFGGTYVTPEDIKNISKLIGVEEGRFTGRYCNPSGSRFVLAQKEDETCIFFDPEKQCTIHAVKPRMCRAWPFIPTVARHPENWEAMANSCPGMKKGLAPEIIAGIVKDELI